MTVFVVLTTADGQVRRIQVHLSRTTAKATRKDWLSKHPGRKKLKGGTKHTPEVAVTIRECRLKS